MPRSVNWLHVKKQIGKHKIVILQRTLGSHNYRESKYSYPHDLFQKPFVDGKIGIPKQISWPQLKNLRFSCDTNARTLVRNENIFVISSKFQL